MALSAEQRDLESQIEAFIRDPRPAKPWFCYTGAAGTGKTHLLSHIARNHLDALLCAFTGKAASVIARKSGLPAQTIHSAIYACYGKDDKTEKLRFSRKIEEGEWRGRLAFVDEASTCSEWLARDLLATGCKVVASGDPHQLPPVQGVSFFTANGAADASLTEIHRQAWDSPIIRQAHSIRHGRGYAPDTENFRIERMVSRDDLMAADVVLCWRNATRIELNRLIRAHHGYGGIAMRGEPVMALRNSPEWGILNGGVYTLLENHVGGTGQVVITNERGRDVVVEKAWIEDMEGPWLDAKTGLPDAKANPFAFAYCCTTHKFQGSEAKRVIIVDEYDKADQRDRWLYTSVTRASESIIVQRFW